MQSLFSTKSWAFILPLLFTAVIFTSCAKDTEKFTGSYSVVDLCASGYSVTITESASTDKGIVINNFLGADISVIATVNGDNITIANQSFTVGNASFSISGSGAINGNILSISYTVTGDLTGTCTATCTKQ